MMMLRKLSLVVLAGAAAAIAGCSGGGAGAARIPAAPCPGDSKFCLQSCNLGCRTTGTCAVTEIAQNQPIELSFSQEVDPSTVTAGAISLKTAAGETPAGRIDIVGEKIVFTPLVSIVGGVTTFGFRADETYILSLPAGRDGQVLRSVSGDPLSVPVNCTLTASGGLIDRNGRPPESTLVAPTMTRNVPLDATIVVEFDELIDLAPFRGGASPIRYRLRKTRPVGNDPSNFECDPAFSPIDIFGVPQASVDPARDVTVISFKAGIKLPAKVCVEVVVTDRVRDLAGTPAKERTFRFFTLDTPPKPQSITEAFANDARMDKRVSGGSWASGRAVPSQLGRMGEMGSFDPAVGSQFIGAGIYRFDTDKSVILNNFTLFKNGDIIVDDGVYEYTDYIVPEGTIIEYVGSKTPVIHVRGQVKIDGIVRLNGRGVPVGGFDPRPRFQLPSWVAASGQPGADGAPGGGSGGAGGAGCEGNGALPKHMGSRGESIQVPGTSGYQGVPNLADTGGPGAQVYPLDGQRGSVTFLLFTAICGMAGAGGSGGSFLEVGKPGHVIRTFTSGPNEIGPDTAVGKAVAFVPLPAGKTVAEHFSVGGSGGGGGGSTPINMTRNDVLTSGKPWLAGSGGNGGGGVIQFRIGGSFAVGSNGGIQVRGGDGPVFRDRNFGPPNPGGGGSAGTILVQVDGTIAQSGVMDLTGGAGSVLEHQQTNGQFVRIEGGQGAPGYVRFESTEPMSAATLGRVEGPSTIDGNNFSTLAEEEDITGFQSLWYTTGQLFPPDFLHYELTVTVDGLRKIFTDDPNAPTPNEGPADVPVTQGGLIELLVQGAEVGGDLLPIGDPGPWRHYVNNSMGRVSITSDGATGFRFMILFNRALQKEVVVEELRVWFRG